MPRMDSFGLGRSKMLKCQRHNIEIEFVFFCPPRISPKENGWSKRRIPPQTPPPPLTKSEISRGFAKSFPPENSFDKTESALFRHLPETLRAEHQRKMSFPLSRKISPPPNQESKRYFSLVLPSEARQWWNDSFHIGILLEEGSDFLIQR